MNMSRQFWDKKSNEKSQSNFLGNSFQWDSNSSNEEPIFDSKSEVLWSRERNNIISQNDFFRGLQNDFSDLTEGSTSSCSWHNDDFDMTSGNKVKASLEAIEDALYEQKESPLINETVFQECCDWSKKFTFLRLKGEKICDSDDSSIQFSSQQNFRCISPSSLCSSLQIEGKKMTIHAPENPNKKTNYEKMLNDLNEFQNDVEETLAHDGEYKEDCLLDMRDPCNKVPPSQLLDEELVNMSSATLIQDKIIEKVALEIWPNVLAVLEKLDDAHVNDNMEDFQLPPIVPIVRQRQIFSRPRTEGTDSCLNDFPRLESLLSISPKVLQSKPDHGSWRPIHRSRPNSEIHLHHHRHHVIPNSKNKQDPQNAIANLTHHLNDSSTHPKIHEEKEVENVSLLLPSVNEDILEPTNVMKKICIGSELPENVSASDVKSSMKTGGFLPPIHKKNYTPSNATLTQNLFTFFGSPLKSGEYHSSRPATRPTTRPNTSAFRKNIKYSANLKHKFSNEGQPSLNQSKSIESKLHDGKSLEKPVTLFPIVTSLLPPKERTSSGGQKGSLNAFGGGRQR